MKIDLDEAMTMLARMSGDAKDLLEQATKANSSADIIAATSAIIMIETIGFSLETLCVRSKDSNVPHSTFAPQMPETQSQEATDALCYNDFEDTERLNTLKSYLLLPCPIEPC